jgi:hypothetical protein
VKMRKLPSFQYNTLTLLPVRSNMSALPCRSNWTNAKRTSNHKQNNNHQDRRIYPASFLKTILIAMWVRRNPRLRTRSPWHSRFVHGRIARPSDIFAYQRVVGRSHRAKSTKS